MENAVYLVRKGKKTKIYENAEEARSTLRKMRGIMFRKNFQPLLFTFSRNAMHDNSIHSFFCTEFDAVFMDERKVIVDVVKGIKPFTPLIIPARPCRFLLELPKGEADRKKLRVGMKLAFG